MELRTQRLKIVLQTREEVERMIEAMSEHERAQDSPEWLARMRAAQGPDQGIRFRALHGREGPGEISAIMENRPRRSGK